MYSFIVTRETFLILGKYKVNGKIVPAGKGYWKDMGMKVWVPPSPKDQLARTAGRTWEGGPGYPPPLHPALIETDIGVLLRTDTVSGMADVIPRKTST